MHDKPYVNRDLSWLEFNRRVLQEAQDPAVPLLERVKFLAIFSSNLDEFFMVRVAGLKRRIRNGDWNPDPAGLFPKGKFRSDRRRRRAVFTVSGDARPAFHLLFTRGNAVRVDARGH